MLIYGLGAAALAIGYKAADYFYGDNENLIAPAVVFSATAIAYDLLIPYPFALNTALYIVAGNAAGVFANSVVYLDPTGVVTGAFAIYGSYRILNNQESKGYLFEAIVEILSGLTTIMILETEAVSRATVMILTNVVTAGFNAIESFPLVGGLCAKLAAEESVLSHEQ